MGLFVLPTPHVGAFEFPATDTDQLVATAIHAGHQLRPEVREHVALDAASRLREEDPFTELIATGSCPRVVVVKRSRFEVDLNRPRDRAVYRRPEDCWGLDVWRSPLPSAVVDRSLELHDSFYLALGSYLDRLAARGPFVVFDVHSYNHRRDSVDANAVPAANNPDVNVGTGSMDRERWAPVVDGFIAALRRARVCGEGLDVRENVRFRGAHLAAWVHQQYPTQGCALALEFKKTFMDERTGNVNPERLLALRDALATSAPSVRDALHQMAA